MSEMHGTQNLPAVVDVEVEPPTALLEQVKPETINELFDKDVLTLTDDQVDRIILAMREQRQHMMAGMAAGQKPGAAARAAKAITGPAKDQLKDLTIDDLGI